LVTFFSLILFIAILLFLLSNFYPILNNGKLSLLEKGISIVLLISFLYSGLHCVGYIDHLIKSLTIYDNQLIRKNKAIINSKGSPVAIIIPTLNENPDMVKQTILKAKNVDYENEYEKTRKSLQKSINELKELDRALIILFLEAKSYKEIAEILGITETNVATKISRIKDKLKQKILNYKN